MKASLWEQGLMIRLYALRRLKDKLIVALGGYDRVAVTQLMAHARAAIVEQELAYDGSINFGPVGKVKQSICKLDPDLGRMYGYMVTAKRKPNPNVLVLK